MSVNVDSTADVLRAHKNVRCLKGSEGVTARHCLCRDQKRCLSPILLCRRSPMFSFSHTALSVRYGQRTIFVLPPVEGE